MYRELVALEVLGRITNPTGMERVREALGILQSLVEDGEGDDMGYCAPLDYDGRVGRPRFYISRNQLVFMLERRFTVPQIASILRVSIRTIRRRMSYYQLSVSALYTPLTDQELDAAVI